MYGIKKCRDFDNYLNDRLLQNKTGIEFLLNDDDDGIDEIDYDVYFDC